MTYIRVLPRDLFNEANLLKCYGRLWILLDGNERAGFPVDDADSFEIVQSDADGSTYVENLPLIINGNAYRLTRPLNSRDPWPLYAEEIGNPDAEQIAVLDDLGNLTEEMENLIDPS